MKLLTLFFFSNLIVLAITACDSGQNELTICECMALRDIVIEEGSNSIRVENKREQLEYCESKYEAGNEYSQEELTKLSIDCISD